MQDLKNILNRERERILSIELKPCPFCGFIPVARDADCVYPSDRERRVWSVHCYETGGGCGAEVPGNGPEDSIKRWNSRVN